MIAGPDGTADYHPQRAPPRRPCARCSTASREAGGRPFVVGGAVRDALLGLPVHDYDVEVFGLAGRRACASVLAGARPRQRGRRGLHGLQAVRPARAWTEPWTSSLPRRDSKVGPGPSRHRGRRRSRRSRSRRPRAGATSRSTRCSSTRASGRRSVDPYRRPRGSRGAPPARGRRARRSARTRCARCAPCRWRRASSSTVEPGDRRACARRCRSRELPRGARLRRDREAAAARPRARRSASRLLREWGMLPARGARADPARGHAAGSGVASRGRRLDAHAAGRRRGERARSRTSTTRAR